jgi:two-component system, NtrC family, sensor kinase
MPEAQPADDDKPGCCLAGSCSAPDPAAAPHAGPDTAALHEATASPICDLAEDPQKESQAWFHALFEGVETGIFIIDPDTHILVNANSVAAAMVGLPRERIVGSLCHKFVCPAEKGRCPVTDLGQAVDNSERILLTAKGERRAIIKTVRTVNVSGKPRLLESFVDITDLKRVEASLRASEDRFRTAFEDAPFGLCMTAPNGRFMHANAALCAILGYSEEELLAGAWQEITHPDDLERSRQAAIELSRPGASSLEFEKRYIHKSGSIVWARLKISPASRAPGGVPYFITQIEDITQRRQADEAKAFLASLVESSQDAIIGTTVDGTIVSWNRGARELFGYAPEEIIGKSISLLLPEQYDEELQKLREGIFRGKRTRRETTRICKNGTPVSVELTLSPVRGADGKVTSVASITHDITARKQREQALRENEERYRELFENASEIIFTLDLDGRFTSMNLAAQQTFGFSQAEATQLDIWDLVAPEYCQVLMDQRSEMLTGVTQSVSEIEVTARSGKRVKLELKPRLIRRGREPAGIQAIARDITGRDLAEMELRQTQKLESVGRLASGIAHEINTPIQFVGDNARFLQDSFASLKKVLDKMGALRDAVSAGSVNPDLLPELRRAEEESDCAYLLEEIPRAIAQTLEGVDRVATIVRAMKEFAHPEDKGMAPADLNKALMSTITVARNEWKYVAEIETDFGELPVVDCNISDLNQVFLNLLVNAAHAIADVVKDGNKGRIAVRTAMEADGVHISITDTGSGISETIRSKIFDPFFTTKEVGRGTGQGLAIARSVVVDRHKGSLTFESEVGKGTTFHIRLPLESEKPKQRT